MAPQDTITRRSAMLGAGALAALSSLSRASAAVTQPNILFILADDFGYADASCYGRREYTTTNIDALARDGMRLMQAYANSSVCSPTRVALVTGRYQARFAAGLDEPGGLLVGLPPEHPTLPSLLKAAGYNTALVGKWHIGGPPDFGPLKSGYDHFYGIHSGGVDYFKHDTQLYDDDVLANDAGYMTNLLGDRAVSLVESLSQDPAPFLLSLHFTAPHWPWEGPNDQVEAERVTLKGPGGQIDYDGGTQETYAQMVLSMDTQIGRVLAALEQSGRANDTIVVFTSDNGGERFSDTWPFNGKKSELLEGGIRIPAIVRWPGHVAAGTTSDQVTMSMDWLPTLLVAAGTRPNKRYPSDGMSFLKTLTAQAKPKPRKLYWRYSGLDQAAMRDGDWKYLTILGNSFLFNVVQDPLERANLKDRHPDVFARMVKDWEAWNKDMLPYTDKNISWTPSARNLADRYGAPNPPPPSPGPQPVTTPE